MNRIIYKSLAAIGLMGVAYYLYNPRKYNKMAKDATRSAANSLEKGHRKLTRQS